ncbi:MAG: hypothetical protein ACK56I_01515, partial [bacterium]
TGRDVAARREKFEGKRSLLQRAERVCALVLSQHRIQRRRRGVEALDAGAARQPRLLIGQEGVADTNPVFRDDRRAAQDLARARIGLARAHGRGAGTLQREPAHRDVARALQRAPV